MSVHKTDREQLIEEAAKAIDPPAWHGGVAHDPRWAGEAEARRQVRRMRAALVAAAKIRKGEPTAALPIWEQPEAVEAARLAYQEAYEADYDAEDCISFALRAAAAREEGQGHGE